VKLGGDTGERWNASVMRVGRPGEIGAAMPMLCANENTI
jgi:hypothetical protein